MMQGSSGGGRHVNLQELLFGLFLVAVGVGTLFTIRKLTMGSAAEMGPGYVPRAVAIGLLGFGAVFAGRGIFAAGGHIAAPVWRSFLVVPLSVAVFALALNPLGLAFASFAAMTVAAAATRETRWLEVSVFSAAMAAGAVLLFIKVLSLPVPMFPW
jgi:hypothetical protein